MQRFNNGSAPVARYEVNVWEERDRLSIVVSDEFNGGKTVAEWWDDDARQMFEDGFFTRGNIGESVMEYLASVGVVDAGASFNQI